MFQASHHRQQVRAPYKCFAADLANFGEFLANIHF
jgi:hypothetical protein